jgi:hypothetical protein
MQKSFIQFNAANQISNSTINQPKITLTNAGQTINQLIIIREPIKEARSIE